jgi:hypothetical protein
MRVDYLHLGKWSGLLWEGIFATACKVSLFIACLLPWGDKVHTQFSFSKVQPASSNLSLRCFPSSQHYPLLCKNHFESNKMVALVAMPCLTSDLTSANCNWTAVMRKNNPLRPMLCTHPNPVPGLSSYSSMIFNHPKSPPSLSPPPPLL